MPAPHPPPAPQAHAGLARRAALACVLLLLLLPAKRQAQHLELRHVLPLPDGGEIVAHCPATDTLLVTGPTTVRLFDWDADRPDDPPTPRHTVDLRGAFDRFGATLRDVSAVAVDPLGRGFAAAPVIPRDNGTRRGRVVFFDLRTGQTFANVQAGFHPDSLVFTPDGRQLLVVNEGEFTVGGDRDAPGSVSLIEVHPPTPSPGEAKASLRGLPGVVFAGDFPFVWHALAPGVTLDGLRLNDDTPAATQHAYRHAEPEYAVIVAHPREPHRFHAIVSLQENNALARFDLHQRRWIAVWPMGTIPITLDADDTDGQYRPTDHVVHALPMPDTIVAFPHPVTGRPLIATADEGDFRPDDHDKARLGELHADAPPALARLNVDRLSTTPDRVVVPGSRGVSIHDARTGQRLGHSGNLEAFLHERDPDRHNLNSKKTDPLEALDSRSDDKGPEPEGLAFATFDHDANPATPKRTYLLVALERQNGLVLLDATDPTKPTPVAYRNDLAATHPTHQPLAAPESIATVVNAAGDTFFLVAYEGNEAGQAHGVGVYRLTPGRAQGVAMRDSEPVSPPSAAAPR